MCNQNGYQTPISYQTPIVQTWSHILKSQNQLTESKSKPKHHTITNSAKNLSYTHY